MNSLMKRSMPAFIMLTVSGCVMAPLKKTADIVVPGTSLETALMLHAQAHKCWSRSWGYKRDGIVIDARKPTKDTFFISAARFATEEGLQEPFFRLEVSDGVDGGTRVSMREGEYACSPADRCYSVRYTDDVKRWLNHDLTCAKRKEPTR